MPRLEEQLTGTSRPGGSSWSKTCSRSCPRPRRRDLATTPRCARLLESERDRLETAGRGGPRPREIREAFKDLKRPLYPYQREGVERFLAAGRLLLADDMGLGKTAQAIACCDILWRSGRIRRGLIIAPASLKPQWAREWAVFSDLPIQVVDGSPERTPGRLRQAQGRVPHHQLRATAPRPRDRPRAGTPTSSCSTRRSGSRTGRPRPRFRSRGCRPRIAWC